MPEARSLIAEHAGFLLRAGLRNLFVPALVAALARGSGLLDASWPATIAFGASLGFLSSLLYFTLGEAVHRAVLRAWGNDARVHPLAAAVVLGRSTLLSATAAGAAIGLASGRAGAGIWLGTVVGLLYAVPHLRASPSYRRHLADQAALFKRHGFAGLARAELERALARATEAGEARRLREEIAALTPSGSGRDG